MKTENSTFDFSVCSYHSFRIRFFGVCSYHLVRIRDKFSLETVLFQIIYHQRNWGRIIFSKICTRIFSVALFVCKTKKMSNGQKLSGCSTLRVLNRILVKNVLLLVSELYQHYTCYVPNQDDDVLLKQGREAWRKIASNAWGEMANSFIVVKSHS